MIRDDIENTLKMLKEGVKPDPKHNKRLRGWRLGVWYAGSAIFWLIPISIILLIWQILM